MEDAFTCTVDKVVFKGDRGWAVIRARKAGKAITVTGALPGVVAGDHLKVTGVWEQNKRFGMQFKATTCISEVPDTREGLARWLSKRAPILPWATAYELVGRFGAADVWRIINEEPERLLEVHGVTEEIAKEVGETCKRFDAERQIMSWLYGIGLTDTAVTETLNRFGTRTKVEIEKDPYVLYYEVNGVSFELADRVALNGLKLAKDDARRIVACTRSIVSKNAFSVGSVYMDYAICVMQAAVELALDLPRVQQLLVDAAEVCVSSDGRAITTRPLFEAERKIAAYVADRLARPVEEDDDGPPPIEEEELEADHYVILATARGAFFLFMAWFVWEGVSWGEALRLYVVEGEKVGLTRLPTVFIPINEARHHISQSILDDERQLLSRRET